MFSCRPYVRILSVIFLLISLPLFAKVEEVKIAVVIPDEFVREALKNRAVCEGYRVVEPASFEAAALEVFFAKEHPTHVVVDGTKGKAGDTSLIIDLTTLRLSIRSGVQRFLLLSSFALYPEALKLPFQEPSLSRIDIGDLQDPYAIAKLTAARECIAETQSGKFQGIVCPYPFLIGFHNTYNGPLDHPIEHIRDRLVYARKNNCKFILVSNDGSASYELLHVDDLAQALLMLLFADVEHPVINIGSGTEVNIKQLACLMHELAGDKKELIFDPNCYDEVPRRVLNTRFIHDLGWSASIALQKGLQEEVPQLALK
jgi:nucleoside-diphosphate-sugar epimerase